jgi:hypothetical protein
MDSSTYLQSSNLITRDVILYPWDGGEPHIISKHLRELKASAAPLPGLDMHTIIIFDPDNLGPKDIAARRSKVWGVESLDPDEEYVLYHSISPDLPVNQTMARLVGADPGQRSRRILWRGDVFVVKRRKWPTRMLVSLGHSFSEPYRAGRGHMEYVDMPPHTLELFNSRLIPQWYNSDKWLRFLQNEVNMSAFTPSPFPHSHICSQMNPSGYQRIFFRFGRVFVVGRRSTKSCMVRPLVCLCDSRVDEIFQTKEPE